MGTQRKISIKVKIANDLAKILSGYLINTSLKLYLYNSMLGIKDLPACGIYEKIINI
jgi:hypothetical protein